MSTPRDEDFDWRVRIRGMSEDEVAELLEKLEARINEHSQQTAEEREASNYQLRQELKTVQLKLAICTDNLGLERERHDMTKRQLHATEHDCGQWRKTALANEKLHNEVLAQLQEAQAKLRRRLT